MRRDLDLIRTILLAVEAAPAGTMIRNTNIEAPGFEPVAVSEHVQLLTDAGYLDANISAELNPSRPRECHIHGLTWDTTISTRCAAPRSGRKRNSPWPRREAVRLLRW